MLQIRVSSWCLRIRVPDQYSRVFGVVVIYHLDPGGNKTRFRRLVGIDSGADGSQLRRDVGLYPGGDTSAGPLRRWTLTFNQTFPSLASSNMSVESSWSPVS